VESAVPQKALLKIIMVAIKQSMFFIAYNIISIITWLINS
jgi:hypothetical protein